MCSGGGSRPSQPAPGGNCAPGGGQGCPTGNLRVHVVHYSNGNAVQGADVRITGPANRNAATDASGNAAFNGLVPGAYQVRAGKTNWTTETASAAVTSNNTTTVTLRIYTPTRVKIEPSPKKIIHPYDEAITFTAVPEPSPYPALTYRWSVDGTTDGSSTSDTLTRRFRPAATTAERRKDYNVSVSVLGQSASKVTRVAQNVNVGTATVAQSNAGMDTFGWTDTNPAQFDTSLTAAQDTTLQNNNGLTRRVRKRALPHGGGFQYGRLQFTASAGSGDMATVAFPSRAASLVVTRSSAWGWNNEEIESMLQHELRHCEHRASLSDPATIWRRLYDLGFAGTYSPFSETVGYYQYVQSASVSYKFLLDYGAIASFVREYNSAKTVLATLTGATQTDARAILTDCYNNAQFAELREPASEGWDHHIDAP